MTSGIEAHLGFCYYSLSMPDTEDFSLVPRPASAIENTSPGIRRVLSGIVADALALAQKPKSVTAEAKFRIGEYEWCEPDYRQILTWAKALCLEPEEVVRR